jgi:hypothetical protein
MEMEMGWRVEQRVGRGSQEQLPRASTEERGERDWRKEKEKKKRGERDDRGNEKEKRKIKQWAGYNFLIE